MTTKLIAFILIVASSTQVNAQTLKEVVQIPTGVAANQKLEANTDEATKVLNTLRGYTSKGKNDAEFNDVYRLDKPSGLKSLFPNWEFYRIDAVVGRSDGSERHTTALVTYNVALSVHDSVVLPSSGDNAEFGTLLRLASIKATTESQRIAVQNAYTYLYGRKTSVYMNDTDALGTSDANVLNSHVLDVDANGNVVGFRLVKTKLN